MSRTVLLFRKTFLLMALCASTAAAQQQIVPASELSKNTDWFPKFYEPYKMRRVAEYNFLNSEALLGMVHDGKLKISLSQLKQAVDENNLDVISARNGANYAQTDILRVKGGGAPRGASGATIPSSLYSGALGAGVGGTNALGSFSGAGISGGARQVIGFARGNYDPSLSLGFSVDRTSSPLNSIIVSGLPEVTTSSTALQARYSQAFTNGASISVAFNNMSQSSNQEFLLYNPAFVSQFSISFTQQLLSGSGFSVGRRFIEAAKNVEKIANESVRLQVNTTLAQAQNSYWDLEAARENVKVAEQSLAVAQRLFQENKMREELGAGSGLDVMTAESEVAARERDLSAAQAAMLANEIDLKNFISKNLVELPESIPIELLDQLPEPNAGDIPVLDDALSIAMRNRSEIKQAVLNLSIQDIAVKFVKDTLRPSLLLFANFNNSGLYGDRVIQDPNGGPPIVLPGGLSQAFHQIRNWSYPEYAVGFSFSINLRNRAAEADAYRAKLERNQSESSLKRLQNNIALEVRKSLIGLAQSKAQVEAAKKATELSAQVLAAEEAKLMEGASTPYTVIIRQRDNSAAQYAEVQARANYAKALVERDRAMGVLEAH